MGSGEECRVARGIGHMSLHEKIGRKISKSLQFSAQMAYALIARISYTSSSERVLGLPINVIRENAKVCTQFPWKFNKEPRLEMLPK